MKKLVLISILIFSLNAFAQTITRGPNIGEVYFFGFTVTQGDDGIYHSVDFGDVALCTDSTTQNSYNMTAIAADKTIGGLYHINMNGGLYYSNDYGFSYSWEYKHSNISPFISSGENDGFVYKHMASHSENFGSDFYSHNTNGFFGIIKYAEIDAGSDMGYCISRKYNIPDTIYFFKAYNHFDSLEIKKKLIFNWSDNIELSRGNSSGEIFLCNKSTNKLYHSLDFGENWVIKNYFSCPNLPIVGVSGGRQDGEIYLHVVYTQVMGQRRHVYIYHSLDYGETFTVYHPVSIGPDPIYANFIAEDTLVEPGDTVQFTDLSNDAETWEWDFNNDEIIDSYEQNPTYIYQDTGYYTVKLNITGEAVEDYGIRYDYIHVDNITNSEIFQKHDTDFIIFPIPAKDVINVNLYFEVTKIQLLDLTGRLVKNINTNPTIKNSLVELSVTDIPSGIYLLLLKAKSPGNTITKKILINK